VARSEENQREGARAVASLETTHGCYSSRKWHRWSCSGGELRWRRQAVAGGLGGDADALGESQQGEAKAVGELKATRGVALEQERAFGGTACRPTAALSRGRGGGRGGRRRGGRLGLICKFKGFRDLTVNQNSSLF
jgi:hypothetical protein